MPEDMEHWTLSSLQTRLIKTGGRLVRHARRLVFQLAEVLVTREMLTGILNQSQGGNYILERWQRHGRCKHQCVGSGL